MPKVTPTLSKERHCDEGAKCVSCGIDISAEAVETYSITEHDHLPIGKGRKQTTRGDLDFDDRKNAHRGGINFAKPDG